MVCDVLLPWFPPSPSFPNVPPDLGDHALGSLRSPVVVLTPDGRVPVGLLLLVLAAAFHDSVPPHDQFVAIYHRLLPTVTGDDRALLLLVQPLDTTALL